MVIPNASHTKTLIPTCFVSPIQRGARDPFLCFSQTTWPAHSVLHLAMSWESRNGVETSKLSAPLPCALACRSTYHHPPCGKAKQRNSCFQAFPLGSSRKTAQLLFSRKMGFPKDRLAVAVPLFSRQNALSFVTNVRTWSPSWTTWPKWYTANSEQRIFLFPC